MSNNIPTSSLTNHSVLKIRETLLFYWHCYVQRLWLFFCCWWLFARWYDLPSCCWEFLCGSSWPSQEAIHTPTLLDLDSATLSNLNTKPTQFALKLSAASFFALQVSALSNQDRSWWPAGCWLSLGWLNLLSSFSLAGDTRDRPAFQKEVTNTASDGGLKVSATDLTFREAGNPQSLSSLKSGPSF